MTSEIVVGIICLIVGYILRPFLEDASKWFYSKVKGKPFEEEDKDIKTLKILLSYLRLIYKQPLFPEISNDTICDVLLKIHDEAQVLESKRYSRIQHELTQFSNIEPTIRYGDLHPAERASYLVPEAKHLIKEICKFLEINFNEAIK